MEAGALACASGESRQPSHMCLGGTSLWLADQQCFADGERGVSTWDVSAHPGKLRWYYIETTSRRIMIVKITSRRVCQEVAFQGGRGNGRGKRRNYNFHSRSWNKKGLEKTTRWSWFTMHYRDEADYKPLKVHLEQSLLRDWLGTMCSCKPGRFSPCPQKLRALLNMMAEV